MLSSKQFSDDAERRYTILEVNLETGVINTVGEFQAYATRYAAISEARWLGHLAEAARGHTRRIGRLSPRSGSAMPARPEAICA